MKDFVRMLTEGTIAEFLLVVMVPGTVCFQVLRGAAVPEVLATGFGIIVGHFFAMSVKNGTKREIEEYVKSLGLDVLVEAQRKLDGS